LLRLSLQVHGRDLVHGPQVRGAGSVSACVEGLLHFTERWQPLSAKFPQTAKAAVMGEVVMRIALLFGVALLGGCAFRTNIVMHRDLNALKGHDVQAIEAKLGYPVNVEMVFGDKVYTWRINDCTLNVGVDPAGHVKRYDYDGSRRECGAVADKLDAGS
jgi:hypothetical protein